MLFYVDFELLFYASLHFLKRFIIIVFLKVQNTPKTIGLFFVEMFINFYLNF